MKKKEEGGAKEKGVIKSGHVGRVVEKKKKKKKKKRDGEERGGTKEERASEGAWGEGSGPSI